MRMNTLGDSHDHWIGEVGDASSSAAIFLLEHAVPVDRSAEGFFLDEVEALTKNSFRTSRRFIILNPHRICKEKQKSFVSQSSMSILIKTLNGENH